MASSSVSAATFEERRKQLIDKTFGLKKMSESSFSTSTSVSNDLDSNYRIKAIDDSRHVDELEGCKTSRKIGEALSPVTSKIGRIQNKLLINQPMLQPSSPPKTTIQDDEDKNGAASSALNFKEKSITSITDRLSATNKSIPSQLRTSKSLFPSKNQQQLHEPQQSNPLYSSHSRSELNNSVKNESRLKSNNREGRSINLTKNNNVEQHSLLQAPTLSRPKGHPKRRPPSSTSATLSFIHSSSKSSDTRNSLVRSTNTDSSCCHLTGFQKSSMLPTDHLFTHILPKIPLTKSSPKSSKDFSISKLQKNNLIQSTNMAGNTSLLRNAGLSPPSGIFKMSPTMLVHGQAKLKRVKDSSSPVETRISHQSPLVVPEHAQLNRNNNNNNNNSNLNAKDIQKGLVPYEFFWEPPRDYTPSIDYEDIKDDKELDLSIQKNFVESIENDNTNLINADSEDCFTSPSPDNNDNSNSSIKYKFRTSTIDKNFLLKSCPVSSLSSSNLTNKLIDFNISKEIPQNRISKPIKEIPEYAAGDDDRKNHLSITILPEIKLNCELRNDISFIDD